MEAALAANAIAQYKTQLIFLSENWYLVKFLYNV